MGIFKGSNSIKSGTCWSQRPGLKKLGWEPGISFEEMVREMVRYDLQLARKDKLCGDHGFEVCNYHE